MKLIILAGVPGCGKSTLAHNMFDDLAYAIVSTDEIRKEFFGSLKAAHAAKANKEVFSTFHARIGDYLRHGTNVIADATNLSRGSRDELRGIANDSHAEAHLILFTNVSGAHTRNLSRDSDAQVPHEVMENFIINKYTETHYDLRADEGPLYKSVTYISWTS